MSGRIGAGLSRGAAPAAAAAATTAAPAAAATTGFSPRTFNVVVHLDSADLGGSRLLQGITARSVEEIIDAIESRLEQGTRVLDADVYNEFTDTYQPLKPSDFPHLPSHLELDLRVTRVQLGRKTDDWTKGDGGVPFTARQGRSAAEVAAAASASPELRRQIVDRLRSLFLPYFNRQQISKSEMAEACSEVMHRFAVDRGLAEDALRSSERQLSLADSDYLRQLSYEYTMESGFDKRQPSHQEHSLSTHRRNVGGSGYDDLSRGTGRHVVRPLASPSNHYRGGGGGGGAEGRSRSRFAPPNLATAQRAARSGTYSPVPGSGRRTPTAAAPNASAPSSPPFGVGFGSSSGRFGAPSLRPQRHHHRLPHGSVTFDDGEANYFREPDAGFYYPSGRRVPSPDGRTNAVIVPPHNGGGGGFRGGSSRVPVSSVGGFNVLRASSWGSSSPPGVDDPAAYEAAGPSAVVSVTYTVAGTMPPPPPQGLAAASAMDLRTVLSPPAIAAADDDIVVTAAVHSSAPTQLCWWLAYGPSRMVLNLDKMYANGVVSTFQISNNAVVLSIKGGTLVPGWEYVVHLDVTEVGSGRAASAQTKFAVPAPGGFVNGPSDGHVVSNFTAPPGIGSGTDLEARRAEYLRAKRAGGSWYGLGYSADGEPGLLSMKNSGGLLPGQVIGGETLKPPSSPVGTVTSITRQPPPRGSPSTLAAGEDHATPARQVMSNSASAMAQSQQGASAAAGGGKSSSGGTFQEQLRDFFVHQVEPLYYLSANPSLSEKAFKDAVRGVSKTYWFSQPSNAGLSDDLKRQIVRDVKAAVAKAREERQNGATGM